MAGQTLTTTILINAKAGNGFSEVGNTLMELGGMVNGVSQQLIDFGKESIDVYRDYEKSMKDAEVALSTTYGRNTTELNSVMKTLDASATEWAATTIFHTDDVANAISEAAHAGWDLDQIMSGIPAAMRLAQAGGLDLSESVNYIVKSTSAAGIGFEDLGHFMDLWSFAANSSASTIGEFGDAMLRMGSTMRFAANPEELMTLIAVTANAGQVGSEAGTLIRNSMMRLVAPTDKAEMAMSRLGATTLETAGLMEDEELAASNARLAAVGFSVFDEQGNLRNVLDIYRDLYVALGEVAGGYEDIDKNQDALGIISSIFPTRTITEALTLLRGAAEGYDGLYEAMMGGDAEGYGQYAAETMMDTLNGKIETFESKVERLKQAVGEELAPQLEAAMESLGGIVDKIAGMDEGSFGILVSGLESLAIAGPGLITAGIGMRAIGSVLSLLSGGTLTSLIAPAALAAIALGGMVKAVERLDEIDYEQSFGNLQLDNSAITEYANGIADEFDKTYKSIQDARTELSNLVKDYESTTAQLKRDLLTDMLTGEELTEDQKESFYKLGDEASGQVQSAIAANKDATMESLSTTFGDDSDIPMARNLMSVIEAGFASDIARAEELSKQLRDAMTSAFKDGVLTDEEVQGLQSIFDQQNELIARQQDIENYVAEQRLLRQAQTLGLDAIEGTAGSLASLRDERLGFLADQQARDYRLAELQYEAQGISGARRDRELGNLRRGQEEQYYAEGARFNSLSMELYESGIRSSELSGAWEALGQAADSIISAGGIVTPEALNAYNEEVTGFDTNHMTDYIGSMVEALGGREALSGYRDYFAGIGDSTTAAQYERIMAMYDFAGQQLNAQAGQTVGTGADYTAVSGTYDQLSELISGFGYSMENLEGYISGQSSMGAPTDFATFFGGPESGVYQALISAASDIGTDVSGYISQALASSSPAPSIEVETGVKTQSADIGEQDVTVSVDADTNAASGAIDELDGQNLTEYVDGDTSALSSSIDAQDGRQLTAYVSGNTSALASAIESLNGRTVTVNVAKRELFAEGGRATTASIFGEAGPEWAIPEEHSQRTAELLDAARAASGFTWPDLLSRLGGMNSDTNASPTTIVYSPTINTNDASGVEAALREDKFRLERWFEERQMRDRMEVYA